MRAAEVAEVTDQQIETAIKHGHLDITLAKTRRTHRYVFTPAAREALRRLHVERSQVFALHQKLAANIRGNNWVAFLNSNLQPAVKQFGLNIKSHSFRVGYVTHLLRYAPVQHVAAIAGHSDIRSTIAYNRYVPDSEHVIELLERGTQVDHSGSSAPAGDSAKRRRKKCIQAKTETSDTLVADLGSIHIWAKHAWCGTQSTSFYSLGFTK